MVNKLEWIDANEALLLVEKVLRGRSEAKRAIAECLRDGDVRMMADERWISKARSIKDAWSEDSVKENFRANVQVECKSLRASKRWSVDQEEWRWPVNKFSISSKISPSTRRHMFAGVKLNRFDVERVVLRRNPMDVGSPGKSEQWTALCCVLLKLERAGDLHEVRFPTMTSLREEVLAGINEGLSDKTIKPAISQIWKLFVKGRAPSNLPPSLAD